MKIILQTLIGLLFSYSAISQITTHVVSNTPGFPAAFNDLQTAINSATVKDGHILLVQGSSVNYGNIVVNKKLTILGPGYFLAENSATQTIPVSAKVNSVHFQSGSNGSVMQGMEVTGSSAIETFSWGCYGAPANNYSVLVEANAIGIIANRLHQALIIKSAFTGLVSKNYLNFFHVLDTASHITISNNIIAGDFTALNSTVSNNVIDAEAECRYITLKNCTVERNIFNLTCAMVDCSYTSSFERNVFTYNPFGDNFGSNVVNILASDIFLWSMSKSTDGRFMIKPGSPATTVDAGPFAGTTPYQLSGISLHPNIYSVTMPNTATSGSGLKIEVKIRAND